MSQPELRDWELRKHTAEWFLCRTRGSLPGALSRHTTVEYSGALYVFGGDDGKRQVNSLHRFDCSKLTWSLVSCKGTPPSPRYFHSSVVYRDRMLVFGGLSQQGNENDCHMYNFATRQWEEITSAGTPPSGRYGHSAIVYTGCMYVFGGYDGTERLNTMHCLNLTTYVWSVVHVHSSMIPSPRCNVPCVLWKHRLFLFSGHAGGSSTNDMWTFDFLTKQWEQIEPAGSDLPTRRYGHACFLHPHQKAIYVVGGGYGSTLCDNMWRFCIETHKWKRVHLEPSAEHPLPTTYHTATYLERQNTVYLFGGMVGENRYSGGLATYEFPPHIPHCVLTQDLGKLLDRRQLSDVTFLVAPDDHSPPVSFTAHQAIVRVRCPRLAALFDEQSSDLPTASSSTSDEQLSPLLRGSSSSPVRSATSSLSPRRPASQHTESPASSPRHTIGSSMSVSLLPELDESATVDAVDAVDGTHCLDVEEDELAAKLIALADDMNESDAARLDVDHEDALQEKSKTEATTRIRSNTTGEPSSTLNAKPAIPNLALCSATRTGSTSGGAVAGQEDEELVSVGESSSCSTRDGSIAAATTSASGATASSSSTSSSNTSPQSKSSRRHSRRSRPSSSMRSSRSAQSERSGGTSSSRRKSANLSEKRTKEHRNSSGLRRERSSKRKESDREQERLGQEEERHVKVVIRDVGSRCFEQLLTFIYTASTPALELMGSLDQAFEILRGSRTYGLDGMVGLFDSAMKRRILLDEGTVISAMCHITKYQNRYPGELSDLRQYCIQYMLYHYDSLIERDDFASLEPLVLVELMRLKNAQNPVEDVQPPFPGFEALSATRYRKQLVSQLKADLERLQYDSSSYDFNFFVGGRSYGGHAAILAARCAFFAGAFRSKMRESKNREMSVLIGEVSPPPRAFQSLLSYIYTGNTDFPPHHAVYLQMAAGFYGFTNDRLRLVCQRKIANNLDPANSLLLLGAADDVGSLDVRAAALQCVVDHFAEIMEDPESPERLEALPKRVLVEVLSSLAESVRPKMPS